MSLINRTAIQQTVPIVLADGTRDSVNLQPNGRLELPTGATVDPTRATALAASVTDTDASKNAAAIRKAVSHGIPSATKAGAGAGAGTTATAVISGGGGTSAPSQVQGTVKLGNEKTSGDTAAS